MTHTTTAPSPTSGAAPTHRRINSAGWVLWVTGLASMVVSLDAFVVTTGLPTIRIDLHTSASTLEWTVTAYTLSFAVLLMTGAALGDRFGRRRVFSAGLVLFAAASAGCATSPNVGWLIASRSVQGAAAAVVMPLALALLGTAFGPTERARALGMFAGIVALSVALGPLVGGAVIEGISWPWIFWVNVPATILLAVLAHRRIPESKGVPEAFDIVGVLLVTAASLGVVWALVRGNTVGWSSAEALLTLIGGLVAGLTFVAWERRTSHPMVPVRLFTERRFALANTAVFLLWGSTFGSIYFLAQYLQIGIGSGPLTTGLQMIPWGLPPILVARPVGRAISRFGERPFIIAGMMLTTAASVTIATIASPDLAYWEIALLLVVHGTGVAITIIAVQSAAMTSVEGSDMAKASGTFNTMRQLGGSFGVAVSVAAFTAAGSYARPSLFVDGYRAAMTLLAILAALVLLIGTLIPRRQHA